MIGFEPASIIAIAEGINMAAKKKKAKKSMKQYTKELKEVIKMPKLKVRKGKK